jgi:hypothetical protein
MTSPATTMSATTLWAQRWKRFSAAVVKAYHAYASWLVSISWRRFIVLAIGLLIVVGILHDKPPFTWTLTENIESTPTRVVVLPPRPSKAPAAPVAPAAPAAAKAPVQIETPGKDEGVEISISKDGIRITPKAAKPGAAASAAAQAASAGQGVQITLPPGVASESVREALDEARRQIEDSIREARRDAEQAAADAEEARRDAQQAIDELVREQGRSHPSTRTTQVGVGDVLMQFTLLWVVASAIIKFSYKGRMQAEVKAAQATETAEAESLKRQVVEARMAAMQAQVEPHFLFNTLASIDHLIETDPGRASTMQKNLIALLRASMPTMREANGQGSGAGNGGGVRDLGRELAVIRPYLEILKVRMEERLQTQIAVPDGLLSAEFPPMMIQTLVENAIKHGLEPKPEGGLLRVAAEIVHGKLVVSVADTGLGFGRAATAGTGVGLANIRERLQLLHGTRATLTVAENQPSGTVVTVTVPYKTVEGV